jgi:hypothetical protein
MSYTNYKTNFVLKWDGTWLIMQNHNQIIWHYTIIFFYTNESQNDQYFPCQNLVSFFTKIKKWVWQNNSDTSFVKDSTGSFC